MKKVVASVGLLLICASSAFAAEKLNVAVNHDDLADMFYDKKVSWFEYKIVAVDSEEEAANVLNSKVADLLVTDSKYESLTDVEYASLGENLGMYWKTDSAQDQNIRLLYSSLCSLPTTKCPSTDE